MITCQINNQSLVTVYDEVVADSVEYLTASFTFSDDWDGYSRTVIFSNYSNNKVLIVTLIDGDLLYLGNNACYVPHEVIESPGFSISVFGIKDESIITTDEKNIVVRESGYKRGEVPEEPTPTDVERIIGIATSAKNVADSVREDADAGLFKGEKGDKGDSGEQGPQGERGETGPQGPQGIPGVSPTTDEHFNKNSLNAQSGKAVNEAVENKADKDGDYPELKAGLANNLISVITENDQEPYNFRTSGGSLNIGSRKVEEIVGGTICWNQHCSTDQAQRSNAGNYTSNGKTLTYNQESVYYFTADIDFSDGPHASLGPVMMGLWQDTIGQLPFVRKIMPYKESGFSTYYLIVKGKDLGTTIPNGNKCYSIFQAFGKDGGTITYKNCNSFDLTLMFGSSIANYIYNLEKSSIGSGVSWFKRYFPKQNYDVDIGTLISVKTSAHKMVGFNLFKDDVLSQTVSTSYVKIEGDDKTSFINFLKKIQLLNKPFYYNIKVSNTATTSGAKVGEIRLTDESSGSVVNLKSIIPNNEFSLSNVDLNKITHVYLYGRSPAEEVTFSNPCFNIQWDGERNGEYEPYHEVNYTLSDVELYGFPMLDENNNPYYDGDVYSGDGKITRNYIKVKGSDLSTIWFNIYNAENHILGMTITNKNTIDIGRIISDKYQYVGKTWGPNSTLLADLTMCDYAANNGARTIYIKDNSCSTVEEFRQAISNVYFVYELQTPVIETENILPYTNPQWVDDWGTEEFVDEREIKIPVGHNTDYDVNLKSKLEMAPDSPEEDGEYILKQTNSENKYVPIGQSAVIYPKQQAEIDFAKKQNGYRRLLTLTITNTEDSYSSDYSTYGRFHKVTGISAPSFSTEKYFKKENGQFILLTEEPSDWSNNYSSYYSGATNFLINLRNYSTNGFSSLRIKAKIPTDSYSNSDLAGYIGSDTDNSGAHLNNYGLINFRKMVGNNAVDTYTVFEIFADETFITYAKIASHYSQVASSINEQISYGREPIINDCLRRVQIQTTRAIGFPAGSVFIIEGIDKS